jgi:hypothetical protein
MGDKRRAPFGDIGRRHEDLGTFVPAHQHGFAGAAADIYAVDTARENEINQGFHGLRRNGRVVLHGRQHCRVNRTG